MIQREFSRNVLESEKKIDKKAKVRKKARKIEIEGDRERWRETE